MGALESLSALSQGKPIRPPNESLSGCSDSQILYVARTSEIRLRAIEELPLAALTDEAAPSALI